MYLKKYFNKTASLNSLVFGVASSFAFALMLSVLDGPLILAPMMGLMLSIPYYAGYISGAELVAKSDTVPMTASVPDRGLNEVELGKCMI